MADPTKVKPFKKPRLEAMPEMKVAGQVAHKAAATAAIQKLTGRANALTRGNGLKLGLKKPPNASAPAAAKPAKLAPVPQQRVAVEIKQKLPMRKATPPGRRRGLKLPRFK